MIKEEIIRIVSGLGLLALSQLIPYDNPQKDEGVRAFYFIIYGLLASIGLFLLTMTMGDVTLFWVSFPPFMVIVPLGTLWLIKKIAEQSNDKKFKTEAEEYDNKFKNYFTSWWDLIKNIFLDIWSLPLNIWSLFIYYAVEFLKIIKMPFDAVYDGLVSVSGAAGDSVNASFNGVKYGLEEIRRYFKVLFVDALWEFVSLGGQICCSVLPPPFNKSTKCEKQTNCMSKTNRQSIREKIIKEAEAEAKGIIARAEEAAEGIKELARGAAEDIKELARGAAKQIEIEAKLAGDAIIKLAQGDADGVILAANTFYNGRIAAANSYYTFWTGQASTAWGVANSAANAARAEAKGIIDAAAAEARGILSDASRGDFSRILGYTTNAPQIIEGVNNYMLIRAASGDSYAKRMISYSGKSAKYRELGDTIINDLKSGDPKAVGRSLIRVGNTAWEGAQEFGNEMKKAGESLGEGAKDFAEDVGGGIASGATTAWNAIFSDVRLKKNLTRVGTLKKGVGIYTWQWTQKAIRLGANPKRTRGVLAQEVAKVDPKAVIKGPEGFLLVSKKYDV
jgi:vacuolar-type H+-ATPase subunit H